MRAAEVSLIARLVALAAGVDGKSVNQAMTAYLDELTQIRYEPRPPDTAQQTEEQLLSRVAALSSSAG